STLPLNPHPDPKPFLRLAKAVPRTAILTLSLTLTNIHSVRANSSRTQTLTLTNPNPDLITPPQTSGTRKRGYGARSAPALCPSLPSAKCSAKTVKEALMSASTCTIPYSGTTVTLGGNRSGGLKRSPISLPLLGHRGHCRLSLRGPYLPSIKAHW